MCCVYACEHGCARARVHVNDCVRASGYLPCVYVCAFACVYVRVCTYVRLHVCSSWCVHPFMYVPTCESELSMQCVCAS